MTATKLITNIILNGKTRKLSLWDQEDQAKIRITITIYIQCYIGGHSWYANNIKLSKCKTCKRLESNFTFDVTGYIKKKPKGN